MHTDRNVRFELSEAWAALPPSGMIVADDVERNGAFAALVEARGVRVVYLETATSNEAGVAFWQRHGYRTQGVRPRYYPNGRDAFAMIKPLIKTLA